MITKNRVIYGDIIVLVALAALYFVTAHFTQNVLAMSLVILVLIGRSIFWHVTWYKQTGKIY
ncbi:hypothetical protein ACPPVU_23795 [Mucilaginibacter sp. McL0603]|uniref:hypothetical protein n=1 Tax=Mucilaginibacter sp. McL0603 TaxID=3415670 RepID=UPI003CE85603